MGAPTFTTDELQQQAQGNAMAIFLVTTAYLKKTGGSLADWTRFAGEQLAPGWREAADWDAMQLGRIWALNMVSTGATLQSLEGDAQRSESVVSNWPAEADLKDAGLTREDVDPFLDIGDILLKSVGAHLTWTRAGDTITFVVTR